MRAVATQRRVLPETLDHLAPDDPQAQRSRRDLRRVNRLMGSGALLRAALRPALATRSRSPWRWLELGAGDGSLLLRLARALARRLGPPTPDGRPLVQLQLLDRQPLVDQATLQSFAQLGWQAQPLVLDVLDWARGPPEPAGSPGPPGPPERYDVILTNLFLHHFEPPALQSVLTAVAARCGLFIACEPRRSLVALSGSRLLGCIGANRVTRHDALLSVRAGFRGQELSLLWPAPGWALREQAAGLFSHLFVASFRGLADARQP